MVVKRFVRNSVSRVEVVVFRVRGLPCSWRWENMYVVSSPKYSNRRPIRERMLKAGTLGEYLRGKKAFSQQEVYVIAYSLIFSGVAFSLRHCGQGLGLLTLIYERGRLFGWRYSRLG